MGSQKNDMQASGALICKVKSRTPPVWAETASAAATSRGSFIQYVWHQQWYVIRYHWVEGVRSCR